MKQKSRDRFLVFYKAPIEITLWPQWPDCCIDGLEWIGLDWTALLAQQRLTIGRNKGLSRTSRN